MRSGALILLIVAAGFFAWLAVTNRLGKGHLGAAWQTLVGSGASAPASAHPFAFLDTGAGPVLS